ncbi:unnamed protein product [Phytophthora lilii]|uniref:Unnamed protein product n=1 Tax=Phytophthora lilii TaxID=2077276 RepID=A0A9W6UEL2_9STRA|nr:unnamed protein product [Phytophthora lilii]
MSAHDIAVNVARGLTLTTTLMLRISLLPDFRRMQKNHSTGDMSVMPCLLLFTNCYAVMFYAIAIDNMLPLFATSILGIVTGLVFNYFFYRWAVDKRAVVNAFIGSFVVCLLVTIYSILALTGYTGQSESSIGTTLGFITIGTTIGLYVSPMATIARVVRTQTASSMPLTMGTAEAIEGFNDERSLSVVVLSPDKQADSDKKSLSLASEKNLDFVALSSPGRVSIDLQPKEAATCSGGRE